MTRTAPTTSCRTCKFFSEEQCRRRAPQVTILMVPQPPTIASQGRPGMAPMPVAAFPPIGEPDHLWCGEHEPRLAVLS